MNDFWKNPFSCCLVGCGVMSAFWGFWVVLGIIGMALTPKSKTPTDYNKELTKKTESSSSVGIGNNGVLVLDPNAPFVPVMTSQSAMSEFSKTMARNDKEGFFQMILQGKVIEVETGTPVKVLETGGFLSGTYRIRILGGKNYTRDGWVPYEWVKKNSK